MPSFTTFYSSDQWQVITKIAEEYNIGIARAVRRLIENGIKVENLGYQLVKLADDAQIDLAKYMMEKDESNQRLDKFIPQIESNVAISEMIIGFFKQRKIAEAYERQIRSIPRHRGSGHVSTPSQSSNGVVEEAQEAIPSYFSGSRADQDDQEGGKGSC